MAAAGGHPGPATEVWWARTGRHDWGDLVPLLDGREQGRLEALRRPPDRERFVLAAVLARCALAQRLGVRVGEVSLQRTCARCGAPHGRPRLAAPAADLELSITHSGDVVGVAVCQGAAVGLDVEEAGRLDDSARLEAGVLAEREQRALERAMARAGGGVSRIEGFLRLWTRKEALTKMAGTGITVPLVEVVVSGPDEPARCVAMPDTLARPAQVTLHDLEAPASGHVASAATAHPHARHPPVHDGDLLLAALTGSGDVA